MPRLLVLKHVAHEPLGTLDPLLRRSGFRIHYVNFGRTPDARPELDGYHGLVMLGGPMNVDDVAGHPHLGVERELVARAIERGLPTLGICLGAQMIARALGAEVRRSPQKEIGWHRVVPTDGGRADPLFTHFGEAEHLFQWHEDVLDLPSGAVHLARSDNCDHQAYRWGEHVYGFQFHLEVDEPMVERWLRVPGLQPDLELIEGGAERVRRDTSEHLRRLQELAERTFRGFVELFPKRARAHVLPSR
ncbi:MAG: type 1 glutamine amidotransferase [Candidatus Binatia bacterium]